MGWSFNKIRSCQRPIVPAMKRRNKKRGNHEQASRTRTQDLRSPGAAKKVSTGYSGDPTIRTEVRHCMDQLQSRKEETPPKAPRSQKPDSPEECSMIYRETQEFGWEDGQGDGKGLWKHTRLLDDIWRASMFQRTGNGTVGTAPLD